MEFLASLQGGVDEQKPSVFELLSEQQLAALLPPTLRYLLAQATARHPRYLIHVLNSFDTVYASVFTIIERYYLRTYGGSFTENFYGLKRERVLAVKNGEVPRASAGAAAEVREALKLSDSDIWRNIGVMVWIPWLKRRLDEAYEIHVPPINAAIFQGGPGFRRNDQLPSNPTLRQRFLFYFKWFLRRIYPSLNAVYHISILAFQLAYLFDSTKYSSPLLWLVGTRMRRMGEADYRAIALAEESASNARSKGHAPRPGQTNSMFHPRVFTALAYARLLASLKILLPTSIFALKFLEWWHASDFARQLSRKAAEGLELPAPIVSGTRKSKQQQQQQQQQQSPSSENQQESPSPPLKSALLGSHKKTPISASTGLPIFTVPATSTEDSNLCPICGGEVVTATASPYGYVFCYTCIHRWVEGVHERQEKFMAGAKDEGVWEAEQDEQAAEEKVESREGLWESGKGRCAVSGRKILGGTEGLRRIIV